MNNTYFLSNGMLRTYLNTRWHFCWYKFTQYKNWIAWRIIRFNNWEAKSTYLFRHLPEWKTVYEIRTVHFQYLSRLKLDSRLISINIYIRWKSLTEKCSEQKQIFSSADVTAFPANANHISLDFGLSGSEKSFSSFFEVIEQLGTQHLVSIVKEFEAWLVYILHLYFSSITHKIHKDDLDDVLRPYLP